VQQAVISIYAQIYQRDPHELLWMHTNLRYFFNALPELLQSFLMDSMTTKRWPQRLERAPTKSGANLERAWRWCTICAKADDAQYGFAYWHVDHQFPGLVHCPNHPGTALLDRCHHCGNAHTSLESLALPPIDGRCMYCNTLAQTPPPPSEGLRRLEQDTLDWIKTEPGLFSEKELRCRYWEAAHRRGRIGTVDITPLTAMADCTLHARLQPQFERCHGKELLTTVARTYRYQGQTRQHRVLLHPLMKGDRLFHPAQHLLAMRFFAGSVREFVAAPQRVHPPSAPHAALSFLREIRSR